MKRARQLKHMIEAVSLDNGCPSLYTNKTPVLRRVATTDQVAYIPSPLMTLTVITLTSKLLPVSSSSSRKKYSLSEATEKTVHRHITQQSRKTEDEKNNNLSHMKSQPETNKELRLKRTKYKGDNTTGFK